LACFGTAVIKRLNQKIPQKIAAAHLQAEEDKINDPLGDVSSSALYICVL
jgi:hypothetical protein